MNNALCEAKLGHQPAVILRINGFFASGKQSRQVIDRNQDEIVGLLPEIPRAVYDRCVELYGIEQVRVRMEQGNLEIVVLWEIK